MGDSGTSLGVCPINRTRVRSSELCYEVITTGHNASSGSVIEKVRSLRANC